MLRKTISYFTVYRFKNQHNIISLRQSLLQKLGHGREESVGERPRESNVGWEPTEGLTLLLYIRENLSKRNSLLCMLVGELTFTPYQFYFRMIRKQSTKVVK